MMRKYNSYVFVVLAFILATAVVGQADEIVDLDKPYVGQIQVTGLELLKDGEIEIDAVGLLPRYRDDFVVYSWILDQDTREVVWALNEDDTDRARGQKYLRQAEKTLDMDAGRYEVYLFAGENWYSSGVKIISPGDIIDVLGGVFDDDDDYEYYDDYVEDCYIRLSSPSLGSDNVRTFDAEGDIPGHLIKHNKLGDSEYIEDGFKLDKPMEIRIYAVLEYPGKKPVDYGWIINADTREKVWEVDHWNTDWAGGGKKNRYVDEEIELDAGTYLLYFVTDDSHSFESFNVNPPWDPMNWGITILPGDDFDRSAYHEYKPEGLGDPLIDFTRARNHEYEEQAFRLKKGLPLHIIALGEYVRGYPSFADYGWIQDAVSGKIVWEMERRNTEHAGGNDKNRMFDGTVELPKGDYVAVYVTDGSHAYRSWNASAPYNPKAWGMAIYPGKGFDRGSFELISMDDVAAAGNLLINITRVRDHERHREKFTLDKETRIHIYALGEGTRSGGMVDYAWIKDDRTGRDVWEMTWRNTYRAGGARKNRMYDDDIVLDPGTYEVTYITDGSHSFNDWNDDRPDDPINWGIKISVVD